MMHDSISPFPTLPIADAECVERDTFVDEVLIRSMIRDGRVGVKGRDIRQQPVVRERVQVVESAVMGSWF